MSHSIPRFIYPGTLLSKRLARLTILFSVGFNLYLNNVQAYLLDQGEAILERSAIIADEAQNAARVGQSMVKLMDNLSENPLYRWFDQRQGLTQFRDDLKDNVQLIEDYSNSLEEIGGIYTTIAKVLWITTIIFWLSIAYAIFWLALDKRFGKQPRWITTLVLLAIPFNFISYFLLHELFPVEDLIYQAADALEQFTL